MATPTNLSEKFFEIVKEIRNQKEIYQSNIEKEKYKNLEKIMSPQSQAKKLKEEFEKKTANKTYKENTFVIDQIDKDLQELTKINENIVEFPQIKCEYSLSINLLKLTGNIKKNQKGNMEKEELNKYIQKEKKDLEKQIINYLEKNDSIEEKETIKDKKGEIIFINFNLKGKSNKEILSYTHKITENKIKISEIENKKIIIDYSSPNVSKQMTIGHLRTTILGEFFKNLFEKKGKAKVLGFNHLGDRGEQFGKIFFVLLYAKDEKIKEFQKEAQKHPNKALFDMYVYYKTLEEKYSDSKKITKHLNTLLNHGDEKLIKLWEIIKKISIKDFEKIYKRLGISFESRLGEAFYEIFLPEIFKDLQKKEYLYEDKEGIKIFFKEDKNEFTILKPKQIKNFEPKELEKESIFQKVLKNSKGVTNYLTRDLASLKFRTHYINAEYLLYITGEEQEIHFKLLEETAKNLNYISENQFKHIGCGLYLKNGKKMSSRDGGVLKLSEVFQEIDQHLNETTLANAAILINDYKQQIQKGVEFDPEKIINPLGDTGIYLIYTAVRWKKILKDQNYNFNINDFDQNLLNSDYKSFIGKISKYKSILENAVQKQQTNGIISYAFEIAHKLSSLYSSGENISKIDDEKRKKAMLCVAYIGYKILEDIFDLMNIELPSKVKQLSK